MWEKPNYSGRMVEFGSIWLPDLRQYGFNDQASSIYVNAPFSLYEGFNYTGRCLLFYPSGGGIPNLAATPLGDNTVSSIRAALNETIAGPNHCPNVWR